MRSVKYTLTQSTDLFTSRDHINWIDRLVSITYRIFEKGEEEMVGE